MKHLVIGAGEVGTAVSQVLHAGLRDVQPTGDVSEMLHVCIPWQDRFIEIVHEAAERHQSQLVVVHSTVPVGTCDEQGWVHSPVRGRHPDLAESLTTFAKHFGGVGASQAAWDWLDVSRVRVHEQAAETEAGKLWELVQFGTQVRVEKAIHQWCEEHGLDPDVVYRQFAQTYNAGYQQLGLGQFQRPVLDHMPGGIGGHCVIPMSGLLDHPLAEIVRQGV